jgi:hypothetical protein
MSSVFVCNLSALSAAERAEYQRLTGRIESATLVTHELDNGYACDIDTSQVTLIDLATWINFERRCCPFFDFGLEWAGEGRLTLRLSGPEGVKPFIRSEFPSIA